MKILLSFNDTKRLLKLARNASVKELRAIAFKKFAGDLPASANIQEISLLSYDYDYQEWVHWMWRRPMTMG
ncbi:MAG: hypothetical protein K0U52_10605 [Gammaproteobacteria bacterium]|nr:hypothetical protein [Gammaproteobacteria bacterium]